MKANSIIILALIGLFTSINLQAAQPEPRPQNWSEYAQLHTRSRFYRLTTAALCATGIAVLACSKDSSMQLCGAGLASIGGGMAGLDLAEQLAVERQKISYIQKLEKNKDEWNTRTIQWKERFQKAQETNTEIIARHNDLVHKHASLQTRAQQLEEAYIELSEENRTLQRQNRVLARRLARIVTIREDIVTIREDGDL